MLMKNAWSSMFPNSYQQKISKTEVKTRNINQYNMPFVDAQMALPLNENSENIFALYGNLVWTKSVDQGDNNFGCSFSINRQNEMSIVGDTITQEVPSRDIRAEYVGGTANTLATMSLNAWQEYVGARLLFQVSLEKLFKTCFLKNWFFCIRTSLVNLKQQLQMNLEGTPESDISGIKNFFANITQNAKIDNNVRSNTGIENVTLSLDGIYKNHNNRIQIYYYSGIEIPTNMPYNTPHLFYPIIGNNGNLGFLLGADFHGYFYQKNEHTIGFLFELENHFLLYKTMNRVFDLFTQEYKDGNKNYINGINKPWSRYLPAFSFCNPYTASDSVSWDTVSLASNLPVRIHECNVTDVSLGGIYSYHSLIKDTWWHLAGGYNLWMAQPDYIELQDRVYKSEYQNFYAYGIAGSTPQTTSSQSTISDQKENDPEPEHFTINSLDYGSSAADGSYSQTLFLRSTLIGCTGYTFLCGAWYEIGKPKMAPSRLGAWVGFGGQF